MKRCALQRGVRYNYVRYNEVPLYIVFENIRCKFVHIFVFLDIGEGGCCTASLDLEYQVVQYDFYHFLDNNVSKDARTSKDVSKRHQNIKKY